MPLEIEKKFLVKGDYKGFSHDSVQISQGYLNSDPGRVVRIRISGNKGFLTVKGPGEGDSRFEWETEIDDSDAEELMKLCEPGKIEKTRYFVRSGKHIFEVDEFHGENQWLVIAEIELSYPDEPFGKPAWLGEEVTGDPRYYNSSLIKNPFSLWSRFST